MTTHEVGIELVVATGDPDGVGPEVSVRGVAAVAARAADVRCVLVGDPTVLARAGADPAWPRVYGGERAEAPISVLAAPAPQPLTVWSGPRAPSAAGGAAALAVLERALLRVGSAPTSALVTAPVSKQAVVMAGTTFAGHTGWLAERCGSAFPVMAFMAPTFRVALATVHVAIADVTRVIDERLLARTLLIIAHDLRHKYGIDDPRVDVLALNPHAGEHGSFGDHDDRVVAPVIARAQAAGHRVAGPFPADGYFRPGFETRADIVLAMYHDQGLIPVKALAFRHAVNVTLGLPMIRTSVDHGTAFDIAWTGVADAVPMEAALAEAARLARRARAFGAPTVAPAARADFDGGF